MSSIVKQQIEVLMAQHGLVFDPKADCESCVFRINNSYCPNNPLRQQISSTVNPPLNNTWCSDEFRAFTLWAGGWVRLPVQEYPA